MAIIGNIPTDAGKSSNRAPQPLWLDNPSAAEDQILPFLVKKGRGEARSDQEI